MRTAGHELSSGAVIGIYCAGAIEVVTATCLRLPLRAFAYHGLLLGSDLSLPESKFLERFLAPLSLLATSGSSCLRYTGPVLRC